MRKEGKEPQTGFLRVEELQRGMGGTVGHSRMSEDTHGPFQSIPEDLPSNFTFSNTFNITGATFFHGTQSGCPIHHRHRHKPTNRQGQLYLMSKNDLAMREKAIGGHIP